MTQPAKERLLLELTSLVAEVKQLNDNAEELFILLQHVWNNRQEIYDMVERHEIARAQEETREQMRYCCDKPDLRWNGDEDHPGVACESCGFPVAENGQLLTYTKEEIEEMRQEAKERQKSLFNR